MKYLYLLFSDGRPRCFWIIPDLIAWSSDNLVPLADWVFNTEAHPLPVAPVGSVPVHPPLDAAPDAKSEAPKEPTHLSMDLEPSQVDIPAIPDAPTIGVAVELQ